MSDELRTRIAAIIRDSGYGYGGDEALASVLIRKLGLQTRNQRGSPRYIDVPARHRYVTEWELDE